MFSRHFCRYTNKPIPHFPPENNHYDSFKLHLSYCSDAESRIYPLKSSLNFLFSCPVLGLHGLRRIHKNTFQFLNKNKKNIKPEFPNSSSPWSRSEISNDSFRVTATLVMCCSGKVCLIISRCYVGVCFWRLDLFV